MPAAGFTPGDPVLRFAFYRYEYEKLTRYIGLAMVLGVLVGYLCNKYAQNAQEAKQIASYFSLITDIFLRMIKMIIAPLVFATLVSGLASMSDASAVGRIGLRAMFWFITASAISLLLGLMLVNVFQPGAHLNLALPDTSLTSGLKTGDFTLKTFITHVFPKSIAEAMANNEILQILVFSLFFGAALSFIRGKGHNTIFNMIDELAKIMFRVTDYVMRFAPLGVFAAMAAAITTEGLGVLVSYGKLIGEFYLGLRCSLSWANPRSVWAADQGAHPAAFSANRPIPRPSRRSRVSAVQAHLGWCCRWAIRSAR